MDEWMNGWMEEDLKRESQRGQIEQIENWSTKTTKTELPPVSSFDNTALAGRPANADPPRPLRMARTDCSQMVRERSSVEGQCAHVAA
jgi:hypothetical protein